MQFNTILHNEDTVLKRFLQRPPDSRFHTVYTALCNIGIKLRHRKLPFGFSQAWQTVLGCICQLWYGAWQWQMFGGDAYQ